MACHTKLVRAKYGGGTRNRTEDKGFADPRLTTWPCRPKFQIKNK